MAGKNSALAQKKQHAHDIFMSTEMTQKEIAEIVQVSEKTMSNWVIKGDWDKTKNLKIASKEQAVGNLYKILVELTKDPQNVNADAISKVTKSIETISDDRVNIPNRIETYRSLINWMRKHPDADIELIKKINLWQNEHIQELVSNVTG